MKETVEQAAICELNHSYAIIVDGELVYQRQAMLNMFRKGAEWQSNQSPWISVEERLPEHDNGQSLCEVLIRTSDGRCCVVANTDVEVMVKVGEATHWMPIPAL